MKWHLTAIQPNISNGMVEYVINKRGSDDVAFANVVTAVEAAFGTWRFTNGSVIDFVRQLDSSTLPIGTIPSRLDQLNVVYWEEDPANSFLIRPLSFATVIRAVQSDGKILDVDIVLNGYRFLWTDQANGNFSSLTGHVDIRETITIGVGEFIGFNRVPTDGSVLEEFSYAGSIAKRTLTQDERAGALQAYPPVSPPPVTSISGRVTRSSNPVFGAYAAAFQVGIPVVGAIADPNGVYSIKGLAPGSYTVRVLTAKAPDDSFYTPLDNDFLSESYSNAATDPATFVTAMSGSDTPMIDIDVSVANAADPWEPDNTKAQADANPLTLIATNDSRQIHHSFPAMDVDVVRFTATAGNLYAIQTSNLGTGDTDSDTKIRLLNPGFTELEPNDDRNPKQDSKTSRIVRRATVSGTHYVEISQTSPTASGSGTAYDISVIDLGPTTSTAAVSFLSPNSGPQGGGYQVMVTGTNFLPRTNVSFGGVAATEVDSINSFQLFVTVPPAASPGPVSIVVTNDGSAPSAPLAGGFTYLSDITTLGTYVDATNSAFGFTPGQDSDAVAWIDYDNDEYLDIYFTTGVPPAASAHQLWRNDADGTFTNVSGSSGITIGDPANPESVAWGDFNNDGCIDVYKVNLVVTANKKLLQNNCTGGFTDVTAAAGVAGRSNGRSRDAAWADYNNDGWLDLFVAYDDLDPNGGNQLFRNQQNGMFTDVAATVGLKNVGSGFNANWADYNLDGRPDLFLLRSGAQSDILYENTPDGTFTDVTGFAGILDTPQGTDAVWGDFDNDGDQDLYVVASTGLNRMFRNNGNETFTDVSTPSVMGVPGTGDTLGSAQAVSVADYDNDGRLDIFVAQRFDGFEFSEIDVLFHNDGNFAFSDGTFDAGVDDPFNGLAAAFGDYTNNFTQDLFVGNAGLSDVLWRNQASRNNALVVRLVGDISNRLGIGARVTITADLDGTGPMSPVMQTREMIGGSKSQAAIEAHFGLGRANVENLVVNSIRVVWPTSGIDWTSVDGLAPNQVVTIYEGPPRISVSRVTPSSGPVGGGTVAVITGMNFEPNATVRIGGTLVTPMGPVLHNKITVTTPPHAAGVAAVRVTNPSQPLGHPLREDTLPGAFIYFSGDPLNTLHCFDAENTTCVWAPVPGATAYDVIRGNVSNLLIVGGTQVSLGSVTCIENESGDTSTAPSHRDAAIPTLGQSYFYLFRVSGGNYGTSSSGLPRVPGSGTCP